MRRTTKKVRQIAEVEEYRVQYEMRKHMDEKTKMLLLMGIENHTRQRYMVKERSEMKKIVRAMINVVGVLSLIGMVLIAIITTRNDYAQYRIGGR